MVDAHSVVQFQRKAHALDPPRILCMFVPGPVIQRVAPQLAVGRKIIWRAARHLFGQARLVQPEQLAPGPDIGRIGRDINGDIPQNAHALFIRISFQRTPLGKKLVLAEFPKVHLGFVPGIQLLNGACLMHAQRLGPLLVMPAPLKALCRHEQGIVFQPPALFVTKVIVIVRVPFGKPCKCLAQHRKVRLAHGVIIHRSGRFSKGQGGIFFPLQKALFAQRLKIDKIRAGRKGRTALIRAVAKPCGRQRQYLPHALARAGQKIYKIISTLAQRANAKRPRQAGNRHQNAALPHKRSLPPRAARAARLAIICIIVQNRWFWYTKNRRFI